MPVSSSIQPWTLRMPQGGLQQWYFTFTLPAPGGVTPYPIPGTTWEYVVRQATDYGSGSPLFTVTTTPSADGLITVTDTAALAQVLLGVYPAATAALAPGTYSHALWMNPGTATQWPWVTGSLIVEPNPQP